MANRFLTRNSVRLLVLVGCLASLAMAVRPTRLTMLVVPARYSVLQVAFDVVRKYPAVLVSYQGDASTEQPLLHAWNGKEWVYVSLEDYENASFLQRVPQQAVLVGDEQDLPPVLVTASAWCPMVMSIPSVDTATLVNSLGKVFAFHPRDWRWFAARYNLEIDDLNAGHRRESWYDGRFEPDADFDLPLEPEGDIMLDPPAAPIEEEPAEDVAPLDVIETGMPVGVEPPLDEVEEEPARVVLPPPPAEPEGWKEEAVAQ